ncbi:hypothetical protein ACQCX5_08820 [Propionibacteriaceae bacterium G57]|uniref:hypothetical protein n=1 Tax=Aestuariimicrobium sp. G57 TaxID=3418485 RepID=UPI003DA79767
MSDNELLLQLGEKLDGLTARIADLESQVRALKKNQRIPEEDIIVIAAAVAAYLGHKATVKAVRFRQSSAWTQEGRERVHNRQVLHVR